MEAIATQTTTPVTAPFKIDPHKGQMNGMVSAQWASRPDDERFTDLATLHAKTIQWANESSVIPVEPANIVATYDAANPATGLVIEVAGAKITPTNYAFDTVSRLAGAPPNYLRELPAPLVAINLNYGLKAATQKEQGAYVRQNGTRILRSLNSMSYGRIFDHQVVEAVRKVAGNGTGDTRWKVPGCIDWNGKHGITYNPNVQITKENTTLYASDRDVFLFLVDDRNPIEIGKLEDGSPDYVFRGFCVGNSEVGARVFWWATMYLRGVCQNRNLWGVEGFTEMRFKHTSGAPDRFIEEVQPALIEYAEGGTKTFLAGVQAARKAVVAKDEDDRLEFLGRWGFSKKAATAICATVLAEEGHEAASVWDFSQGITAMARREQFQEARVALERIAGKMLDKVKV